MPRRGLIVILPFFNLRPALGAFLLSVCLALASATTLAAASLPTSLESRLAPKWTQGAKQIRTPERVIYYHGSARGGVRSDGKHWAGVIKGEILVLTPMAAIACPKVRLGSTGNVSITGSSQTRALPRGTSC